MQLFATTLINHLQQQKFKLIDLQVTEKHSKVFQICP